MQKSRVIIIVLLVLLFLACSGTKNLIEEKMISSRTDVFTEITGESQPPDWVSDVLIKAQVKTHSARHYPWQEKGLPADNLKFRYLFNVDGQAVIWDVAGKEEDTPVYDENGKRTFDGGKGIKYCLEKRIRLRSGPHNVFLALPGENVISQAEITIEPGIQYKLEYKPIYDWDHLHHRSFRHGIGGFEVFFNSIQVR
jgi:hypothetical protein